MATILNWIFSFHLILSPKFLFLFTVSLVLNLQDIKIEDPERKKIIIIFNFLYFLKHFQKIYQEFLILCITILQFSCLMRCIFFVYFCRVLGTLVGDANAMLIKWNATQNA